RERAEEAPVTAVRDRFRERVGVDSEQLGSAHIVAPRVTGLTEPEPRLRLERPISCLVAGGQRLFAGLHRTRLISDGAEVLAEVVGHPPDAPSIAELRGSRFGPLQVIPRRAHGAGE